jgi:hypothetical protein
MQKVNDIVLRGYVSLITRAEGANDRLNKWSEGSSKHAKAEVAGGVVAGGLVLFASTAGAEECNTGSTTKIVELVQTGGGFLAALVAAVSVLMLLYASMLYITAGGNYGRAGKAKETAKNVVIGFGLAACIFILREVILQVVGGATGGKNSNTVTECLSKTGGEVK